MSKINNNSSMLDILKQNTVCKMTFRDELIETKHLYGVFINGNTFVVAKQTSNIGTCHKAYNLDDLFTGRLMAWRVMNYTNNSPLPWQKNDLFTIYNNLDAIAFPIEVFLSKHIKKGVTTKKNIVILLDVMML